MASWTSRLWSAVFRVSRDSHVTLATRTDAGLRERTAEGDGSALLATDANQMASKSHSSRVHRLESTHFRGVYLNDAYVNRHRAVKIFVILVAALATLQLRRASPNHKASGGMGVAVDCWLTVGAVLPPTSCERHRSVGDTCHITLRQLVGSLYSTRSGRCGAEELDGTATARSASSA